MSQLLEMLESNDSKAIYHFFDQAKETRDAMPIHKEGALPAFFDLFIDVPDYPGVISEVTGYLAQEEISLINLKILETREEINGILQLTFQNQEDLKNKLNLAFKKTVATIVTTSERTTFNEINDK